MPPQFIEGAPLNFPDGPFRNVQKGGNFRLTQKAGLMLGTARPYPYCWLARRGTLSRPFALRLLFPPLAQSQSCAAVTHPRRSPDLPPRSIPKRCNPSSASIWQMDTDLDQAPGGHRPVRLDQNLDNIMWSHAINYVRPRHGANDRKPECALKGQGCRWDGCARGRMAVPSGALTRG